MQISVENRIKLYIESIVGQTTIISPIRRIVGFYRAVSGRLYQILITGFSHIILVRGIVSHRGSAKWKQTGRGSK